MEVKKNRSNKLKIFLIILIVLIIIAGSIVLCSYLYYRQTANKLHEQNERALKEISEVVEYGSVISYEEITSKLIELNSLAKGTTYTVKIDEKFLKPEESYKAEKVGDITITIETHCNLNFFNNIITKKENTWKIEDTQMPVLEGVSDKEIIQGEKFDAKEGIKAKDAVDGELEVFIDGNVDTSKVGKYTLTAKATDKNQHETKQEFTVTVKAKVETKQQTQSNNKQTSTSKNNNSTKNNDKNNTNNNKNSNQSVDPKSTKEGRLKLAKEEAQRVVAKIITPGMTKKDKALAICRYLYETVEAQTNQSTEAYKTNYGNEAYAALVLKKAACSGRCNAVMLLCDAAGLECQHVNAHKWTHQWNKVKIDDGSWLVIDSQINLSGLTHPYDIYN